TFVIADPVVRYDMERVRGWTRLVVTHLVGELCYKPLRNVDPQGRKCHAEGTRLLRPDLLVSVGGSRGLGPHPPPFPYPDSHRYQQEEGRRSCPLTPIRRLWSRPTGSPSTHPTGTFASSRSTSIRPPTSRAMWPAPSA